ncbi:MULTISPECIES: carbohydrate ABC transporter permease [unclassified Mesotoga]|jgi:multiple sugar transport system permease protein|uniref:carbohydrate ABC transporter permease n=1 Tax=unclassified Mesotoga TaxID=1184398 RepID=UPI000EF14B2E|nr:MULTISPECIES: carbohydrate ABC transporter permease [unclassified Mesotoga]MDI9366715.1 carbohydrate ABC transporter permease [Thermotogota bacterium]MDD4208541.1 carbohydrate ABC transporter permease [Mesotoga sp.]MDD4826821.1 carbohydrate ABC transporter permease [Mesotoga sp.]MDD5683968.1 carbohydrate ABC transporter permease [Mesotoga sp.]MDK2944639.1 multiple sugar transport system permease protein [Mesotoga sp.]
MNLKKLSRRTVYYLVMLAFSFFILLPFFWMVSTSLKEAKALTVLPIQWFPEKISFDGFVKIFDVFPFGRAIFNSIFISTLITFVTVMSACMAAYVFSKIKFRGREVLFGIYIATMMIPANITMIPNYLTLKHLSLLNSYVGIMLPSLFNAFGTFMIRQYMRTIPDDFVEAAVLDGASHFRIFFRMILPLSKPAVATLTVITFMGAWNDYLWPLIVLTDKNKMTLPVGLSLLNGQHQSDYNMLMAGALISMIPILLIYTFAQRYFEQGLSVGGIKG